jgi:hypothetical protein
MPTGQLATNGIDVPAGFVDMPKYKSHKTVWAVNIVEVEDQGTDTTTDENPIVLLKFDKPYGDLRINLRGKPTPQAGWYLVQYEDGYVSFSPSEQFEKGNTLEPKTFQDRVEAEKSELEEKLGKLRTFFNSSTYGDMAATKKGREEQDRLNEQADIMDRYIAILRERIAAF